MDSDTRTVLLALCELSRDTFMTASETRLAALRIHEALVNAGVPGYLEAYDSNTVRFDELDRAKRELDELVEALLRKARTNLPTK